MTARTLRLYLDPAALARLRAGTHNFFGRLVRTVEGAGWRVDPVESTLAARLAAPGHPGHALFHMEEPTHDRALTCRRCYVGAFWRIEAQAARWDWPVARARFAPADIDPDRAGTFMRQWRRRLWPDVVPVDHGHVFVPLQGRLLDHRGFQSMSPVDMVREVLARTDRPVIATLHPGETCSAAEEQALAALARHPRLTVQRGGSAQVLQTCHRVVTQNSALAFEGYFLEKPAILFARIDFHHIAASVPRDGIDAAFAPRAAPDYARYLDWFLRERAINAGAEDCGDRILAALRHHGWPI